MIKEFVCVVLLVMTAACSSDDEGNNSQPAGDATNDSVPGQETTDPMMTDSRPDTSAIAGLWDARIETADGVNEIYKLISSDGIISDFDYRQDDVGSGENCYDITGFSLNPLGDNEYAIGNKTFVMARGEEGLMVEFVDVDDVDRDGNTTETLQQLWPLIEGIDEVDLPSCGI